jgi:hypothetical protein
LRHFALEWGNTFWAKIQRKKVFSEKKAISLLQKKTKEFIIILLPLQHLLCGGRSGYIFPDQKKRAFC